MLRAFQADAVCETLVACYGIRLTSEAVFMLMTNAGVQRKQRPSKV